jgi:DNA polymerase-3 subunit epsilon
VRIDRPALVAALAPAAWLLAFAAGAAALLAATMEPAERAAVWQVLESRIALVLMLAAALAAAGGWLLGQTWKRHGAGPARLAEQVRALVAADVERDIDPSAAGGPAAAQLAQAINELTRQRGALRRDIDAKVREASRDIEQERSRLAALMAELQQSVVVCNLDGRVLLYNQRARLQFRALAAASGLQAGSAGGAGGNELIGIGRSIYAVFDRELVAHALDSVRQRLARGAANPSAQFVTATGSGQLLRASMTPVRAVAPTAAREPAAAAPLESPAPAPDIAGFVLMLDNITRDFAEESERDRLLHQLTEASRASLGNLQAAVELLDDPELDAATRERFQTVVRDEAAAMTRRIQQLAEHTTRTLRTRWPLEEMRGADLVEAALRRIEQAARCRSSAQEVDAQLWLKVDSFSLLQALAGLAARLVDEYELKRVDIRLARADARAGDRAQLDLIWTGQAMSTETVMNWETDPIRLEGESTPLTVRDVVERHGGAFWFERERVRHQAFFRFLLPLATGESEDAASLGVRSDSRPEFYDFDLFQAAGGDALGALADRSLAELSYTVFDTETTGLNPGDGDEILQIGATRIVAGKLRRQECYDQLVDPQCPIPEAGIPIHGIRPDMVVGQPTVDRVLPAFHAFAADTVLVAHNAAFDMRFLQLKEASTGVRFEQPVLDTLLLSAVVAPQQESHSLEAIAQRLGVTVLGRHTAVGDAMVTAEVFLKLIPLLQERGIRTLGQALAAAQQTYYARVKY